MQRKKIKLTKVKLIERWEECKAKMPLSPPASPTKKSEGKKKEEEERKERKLQTYLPQLKCKNSFTALFGTNFDFVPPIKREIEEC